MKTAIGLAWTDGARFVGIRPPLADDEIDLLRSGLATSFKVEQITGPSPACTLLKMGARGDDELRSIADQVSKVMAEAGRVCAIDTVIFTLEGHDSSPFNPIPHSQL